MFSTFSEELEDPITIADLLSNGSSFNLKMDSNSHMPELYDDDFGSDDENSDNEEINKLLYKPWEQSFAELRKLMSPVSDLLYKRITKEGFGALVTPNSRVQVDYNAYFEEDVQAFDSTALRRNYMTFCLGNGETLEGFEEAVRTMRVGEEAQFLISYKIMFGEHGCHPRIRPKADVLMVAKLIKFDEVGDPEALLSLTKEDQRKFPLVKEKVEELRKNAKDCTMQNKFHEAVRLYRKAEQALQLCVLENNEQQKEQEEILGKLYTNLCVCYNKIDKPKQVCIMIRELARVSNVNQNSKALFNHGRALLKLSEYDRAKDCLLKALRLSPNDGTIKTELKLVEETQERVLKEEKSIWTKALGMKNVVTEKESQDMMNFKNVMMNNINDFVTSSDDRMRLPDGLKPEEIDTVEKMILEMDLQISTMHINNKVHYNLVKK